MAEVDVSYCNYCHNWVNGRYDYYPGPYFRGVRSNHLADLLLH